MHRRTAGRQRAEEKARADHLQAIAVSVAEARDEIARCDTKATTLQGISTGALAGLYAIARADHMPLPATVLLWLAAALALAALAVALSVVRPRLGKSRRIFADHEQLLNGPAVDLAAWNARRLRLFSGLAVAKHRRVRLAIDLLRVAGALLIAATATTLAAAVL